MIYPKQLIEVGKRFKYSYKEEDFYLKVSPSYLRLYKDGTNPERKYFVFRETTGFRLYHLGWPLQFKGEKK